MWASHMWIPHLCECLDVLLVMSCPSYSHVQRHMSLSVSQVSVSHHMWEAHLWHTGIHMWDAHFWRSLSVSLSHVRRSLLTLAECVTFTCETLTFDTQYHKWVLQCVQHIVIWCVCWCVCVDTQERETLTCDTQCHRSVSQVSVSHHMWDTHLWPGGVRHWGVTTMSKETYIHTKRPPQVFTRETLLCVTSERLTCESDTLSECQKWASHMWIPHRWVSQCVARNVLLVLFTCPATYMSVSHVSVSHVSISHVGV